ncbi:MAG: hypothetical protein K2R98_27235 [Gemmataceae bacterium]|nr:hypothetical protein [Gemmataceae bacterium]
MFASTSIFLDFNLPNAATWFYLSLLLAVALFFKFSRFLSVRNWDVLTLFLLVPGLLLRQEAMPTQLPPAETGAVQAAPDDAVPEAPNPRLLWFGYLWLLCGSAYFMARCLMDLALVRRPALSPNLNLGGMAWLAGALFICLVAVAVRRTEDPMESVGKGSAALDELQKRAGAAVQHETGDSPEFNAFKWVSCGLAILCQLAVAVALVYIGCRHFQDAPAGMAAATFYLLLPYTASNIGQVHHVWPTALLLWAIAAYRLPTVSGLLVGLAAGSLFFPALTLPVWISFYWRRGAGRFLFAFLMAAVLCLSITGLILWMDGELAHRLHRDLESTDWQPWKVPAAEGIWTGVHWAYRIPIFIGYVAFVLTTAFWPRPKNLAHLIALSAAVLIGIQFWFADKGGLYVLWYLPLLLLLVFRPNLADRQPLPIQPETDWLHRLGRRAVRGVKRALRVPEPLAPVR